MNLADSRHLKRIAELEAQNEELRHRIRVLERAFETDLNWSALPRLSKTERQIMLLLLRRGTVAHDRLYDWLYSERDHEPPTPETVKVILCRLRKKLAPLGVEIRTVWGHGLELPQQSRATLDRILNQVCAAA